MIPIGVCAVEQHLTAEDRQILGVRLILGKDCAGSGNAPGDRRRCAVNEGATVDDCFRQRVRSSIGALRYEERAGRR
jgi:hypothetical protein